MSSGSLSGARSSRSVDIWGHRRHWRGLGDIKEAKRHRRRQCGTSAGNPCRDNEWTLVVREANFGLILGGQEVDKVRALTCKTCSDARLVGRVVDPSYKVS